MGGVGLSTLRTSLFPKAPVDPFSPHSQKPRNAKRGDFRRNIHTLLLQMSLSWVLLLPGDFAVVIPLGHPSLEGTLK